MPVAQKRWETRAPSALVAALTKREMAKRQKREGRETATLKGKGSAAR